MPWGRVKLRHVAAEVAKNALAALPVTGKLRARRSRTAPLPDVERYAFRPFRRLLEGAGSVCGRSVLEIGPGDHMPVGLLALGAGASRYVALDRFRGDVDGPSARRFYSAVAAAAPTTFRWDRDPSTFPWPDLALHVTAPLETGIPDRFDVIFGFATMEHVTDVPAALASMRRMLAPGGVLVHWIDYAPHDVWKRYADPFAWLTIPDRVWRAMGSNRGTPNRIRHPDMLQAFEVAGLRARTLVTKTFGRHSDPGLDVQSALVVAT